MYIYVLCCTPSVGVCIVWWSTQDVGILILLCCKLGVGVWIVCQLHVHVLHGIVNRVWLYVCDEHYVYVYMVEEKELGVFQMWKLI